MSKDFSLALSGGGFRASIFHIGVLMNLAEKGLLQRTTTLSTVSGGSIVGVYYYLYLKYLLETTDNVSERHIVSIVKQIKKKFSKTMCEKNIILEPINPLKTGFEFCKILISTQYTRTDALTKVYQREIFDDIWKKIVDHWKKQKKRPVEWEDVEIDDSPYLYRLKIYPKTYLEESNYDYESFDINEFNKNNSIKIPDLIINATNLNTGKLWRFSATKFGEYLSVDEVFSIKEIKDRICSKHKIFCELRAKYGIKKLFELLTDEEKLKYFYSKENFANLFSSSEDFKKQLKNFFEDINGAIENHMYHFFKDRIKRKILIGEAVVASTCVPGIFSPFLFKDSNRYKEIYKTENFFLVDGGVYDNQGLESIERKYLQKRFLLLRNNNCKESLGAVFCSDASGQFEAEEISVCKNRIPIYGDIKTLFRSSGIFGDRMRRLTINKLYEYKYEGNIDFVLIHLKQNVVEPVKHFVEDDKKAKEIGQVLKLNAGLRTQLNKFWREEIISLITHSYVLSEFYINKYLQSYINPIYYPFRRYIKKLYLKDILNNKDIYREILTIGKTKFSTIPVWLYKKFRLSYKKIKVLGLISVLVSFILFVFYTFSKLLAVILSILVLSYIYCSLKRGKSLKTTKLITYNLKKPCCWRK